MEIKYLSCLTSAVDHDDRSMRISTDLFTLSNHFNSRALCSFILSVSYEFLKSRMYCLYNKLKATEYTVPTNSFSLFRLKHYGFLFPQTINTIIMRTLHNIDYRRIIVYRCFK